VKLSDDDFTLLGLPPHQALERAALDEQRRRLQAEVHPDRFAGDGAAAQRLAMQWALRVNQAWQRLKNPLTRAAYLCELRGVPIEAENNTAMPRDFLLQQMAWREALDDADGLGAVESLDADVAAQERALHTRLVQQLDVQADAHAAAATVRALMFVSRFREELARRLDTLQTS
jgi:molecular chaperone HscB